MVAVATITESHFSEIYERFLRADDPGTPRAQWKPLFSGGGEGAEYGKMLVDQDRIVGMLGMYFSRRQVDGQKHPVCNVHSWIVEPEFRGHSLFLLRPLLVRPEVTITDFTPTPPVYELSQRLGFKPLDASMVVLPGRLSAARPSGFFLETNPDRVRPQLADGERELLDAHRGPGLKHLWLKRGRSDLYLIYARVDRFRFPFCHILYLSNAELFAEAQAAVRPEILRQTSTRLAAVARRLLRGVRIPRSVPLPVQSRQLVRSQRRDAAALDFLYSEVSYLNLCTFPNLRDQAKRLLPRRWRLGRQASRGSST